MSIITHATLNRRGATKKENPIKACFKNQSATPKSSTATNWKKKFVPASCSFLVIAFILSLTPANAKIATTMSGTHVNVSNYSNAISISLCGFITFNFEQRMRIDGKSMLILTQQTYEPGRYDLVLYATCDGYNIYDLSGCNCLTIDFPKPSIANDSENTSTEITEPGPMQLITTNKHTGVLWIRKKR